MGGRKSIKPIVPRLKLEAIEMYRAKQHAGQQHHNHALNQPIGPNVYVPPSIPVPLAASLNNTASINGANASNYTLNFNNTIGATGQPPTIFAKLAVK